MKVKLADVCTCESSNLKQSDVINISGKYPVYGATGKIGYIDTYKQEKPYIAIVKDGAGIGRTHLCDSKSSVIGTLQYILPKDNVLPEYLFYVIKHMHLEKYYSGATIPHIYFKNYKNEEFNLDSINKQETIINILNDCNKLINLKETQLKKYDDLIKARFIEMFGNLPEDFKHDAVELGSIADVISGGTPSSKHPEYYGDKYPFVTTPCLGSNYISENDAVNWLSDLGVEKSSTHIIPAYSVMYGSRVGVGKSSINTCEMCTNQDILSFYNIDTSTYDLLFIKKVMDQYFEYIDMQKRGSTIKGVPSDVVKAIRIPLVPIEEQKLFAAFAEQSDKSKYDDMYIRY